MEAKDITILLVFHALLFFCWRKMILFLRKGEKKHVKMMWCFIGLYFLLFFLQWYVSGWENGMLYMAFGALMVYFPFRVISPLKTEMNRMIKKIMAES